jgi:hypothetical protein
MVFVALFCFSPTVLMRSRVPNHGFTTRVPFVTVKLTLAVINVIGTYGVFMEVYMEVAVLVLAVWYNNSGIDLAVVMKVAVRD